MFQLRKLDRLHDGHPVSTVSEVSAEKSQSQMTAKISSEVMLKHLHSQSCGLMLVEAGAVSQKPMLASANGLRVFRAAWLGSKVESLKKTRSKLCHLL